MGEGISSAGEITHFDPPKRFSYVKREWEAGVPPVYTDCFLEKRADGLINVRIAHYLTAYSDSWDKQMEGFERGWGPLLRNSQDLPAGFRGTTAGSGSHRHRSQLSEEDLWPPIKKAFGLTEPALGQRGAVEVPSKRHNGRELLLRIDEPLKGIAPVGVYTWGNKPHGSAAIYFYGKDAQEVAGRHRNNWLEQLSGAVQPTHM